MDPGLLNDIISTSVGGAAGGAVAGLVLYGVQQAHLAVTDWRDTVRVLKWMKSVADSYPYRSTRAIASFNNLTEDRTRYICSRCPEIILSRGEKEDLWTINKLVEEFRDVQSQQC